MSLSEQFVKPSSMLYRNFLAMETEELLRPHPVDGAVLMGGCDKTTPATIMGGISMNLPMIFMPAGPMMRGHFGGKSSARGSDVWKYWAEKEAGNISEAQWNDMEAGIARSAGTCMTMGTASTMTTIAEALGFTLPGAASIPAADSAHPRMADVRAAHRRDGLGGSQAARHRHAQVRRECAGRAQRDGGLDQCHGASGRDGAPRRRADRPEGLRRIRRRVPVILNLRPSGKWLMEDLHIAGGTRAFFSRARSPCCISMRARSRATRWRRIGDAQVYNDDVIRPLNDPIAASGGTAILYGNLAPDGCVIKPPAADPRLLQHSGPAIVFDSYDEMSKA